MTMGYPGSAYQPTAEIAYRLQRWRSMAGRGVLVDDIARALGISRATLDVSICRARKHGHPDAILHPLAAKRTLRNRRGNNAGHRPTGEID